MAPLTKAKRKNFSHKCKNLWGGENFVGLKGEVDVSVTYLNGYSGFLFPSQAAVMACVTKVKSCDKKCILECHLSEKFSTRETICVAIPR